MIKAGKRFGKSKWAVFEICQWAGMKKGVYWYIAPTFGQAADIAWYDLINILPPQMVLRKLESKLTVELKNGSRIILKGAENEDGLRGVSLDGVVFDEAAYIDSYVWPNIILGQLSVSRGPAYFISSPNKKGMNWFTGFCAEAEKRQKAGDRDWAYFYYTIYDNPIIHPSEIELIKSQTLQDRWNLEYLAIESAFSGQIYQEFTEQNIGEYNGTTELPIFRSLDWGISHPTVCLWSKLDINTKTLYVYDEYVKSGKLINESCEEIVKRTMGKAVEWSVIDPSTAKRNSQTGRSDKDEFARWGVTCIPADNRDRGYDVTRMMLKKLMVKISPSCADLINELRTVQWGQDEGDDATDCLRYMCLRINDFIHGMNVMNSDGPLYDQSKLAPNTYSIYDERLFPVKKTNQQSWLMEEINVA